FIFSISRPLLPRLGYAVTIETDVSGSYVNSLLFVFPHIGGSDQLTHFRYYVMLRRVPWRTYLRLTFCSVAGYAYEVGRDVSNEQVPRTLLETAMRVYGDLELNLNGREFAEIVAEIDRHLPAYTAHWQRNREREREVNRMGGTQVCYRHSEVGKAPV